MKVRFPDGTVVKALALRERKEQDPDRDYGLYLDAGWRPTWPATLVQRGRGAADGAEPVSEVLTAAEAPEAAMAEAQKALEELAARV
jgi:hypothetical protein